MQISSQSNSLSTPVYVGAQPNNQQQYQNILAGYQNQLAGYQNNASGVYQNYQQMLDASKGYGQSQQSALDRQFAQQRAQNQQAMISRGLGNTTILGNTDRGIGYDQAMANIGLGDTLTQQKLGIMSQRGQFGQQYAQQYAGLQGQMLGFMGQTANQNTSGSVSYQPGAQSTYQTAAPSEYGGTGRSTGGYGNTLVTANPNTSMANALAQANDYGYGE